MHETETEERISSYWAAKDRLLDVEQQRQLNEITEGLGRRGFVNPSPENPVGGFEMAAWLDPKPLREFFRTHNAYKDYSLVEERLDPRIRFVAGMCLSRASTVLGARKK